MVTASKMPKNNRSLFTAILTPARLQQPSGTTESRLPLRGAHKNYVDRQKPLVIGPRTVPSLIHERKYCASAPVERRPLPSACDDKDNRSLSALNEPWQARHWHRWFTNGVVDPMHTKERNNVVGFDSVIHILGEASRLP